VGRVYVRAGELCQQVAETPQRFQVLWLTYTYRAARGEHQRAHELAQHLLRLAQRAGDLALEMLAHWVLGWNRFFVGEFPVARAHLEQVVAAYDPAQHHYLAFLYGQDPGAVCRAKLACVLWSLGYPEQALARCQEAVALAEELSHLFSLAFCHGLAALLYLFCRDLPETQTSAEASIRISTEYGFAYWLASSTFSRGWALVQQGDSNEGLAQMREGLAIDQAIGSEIGLTQHLVNLAEAHGKVDQAEEGLDLLDEALTVMERNEERFYEAENLRIRGELFLRAKGGSQRAQAEAEAENAFLQAIEVAHLQSARSWELRATMSLARLLGQQGRVEEAQRKLAEIYGWFTEGHDTADLQEARALLAELA
jgi:predicted ATPase